jgi:hypothetical protein
VTPDPFAALGLPHRPDLSDEQVRAAWRAIAAATHPDRPGGGDAARYAAASAAYTVLRTPWSRTEAYADCVAASPPVIRAPVITPLTHPAPWWRLSPRRRAALLPARLRHGRPARLALRVLAAALAALLVLHIRAGTRPTAALLTGIATWLILTARSDLAPPPGR